MDTQGKSALHNPRHEQCAQSVASGKRQQNLTFQRLLPNHGAHASTTACYNMLRSKRGGALAGCGFAARSYAGGCGSEYVLARLKECRARHATPTVLDRKGKETGICTYQGQVANRALELIGTELGMFVTVPTLVLQT